MKGVSYIVDNNSNKKSVVIDIKTIQQNQEAVHDFIDVLVAESRKDEPTIGWETAKNMLKKNGKL
jgi:hypothetical protein